MTKRKPITFYIDEDNRALAAMGMPYRYDDAGYARCAVCTGQYYFRADRPGQPDCPHYDPFHEDIRPIPQE